MKIETFVSVFKKKKKKRQKTSQSHLTPPSKKDSVSLVWTWVTVISPATFQPGPYDTAGSHQPAWFHK